MYAEEPGSGLTFFIGADSLGGALMTHSMVRCVADAAGWENNRSGVRPPAAPQSPGKLTGRQKTFMETAR